MGSTTSQVAQVPSPGRPDSRRSVPPRPPSICQSCWDYPFAAHLGLFGAPGMIMEPSDPDDRNGKIQPVGGYSYSTSWEAVKSSAAAGCLWCQLLLTHCYYPTRPRKRIKVTVGTDTSDASTVPITPKNTQFLMIAVDVHNITMAFEGYVYTSADDPAAPFIVARNPILDVGSTHALSLAKACIDECVHGHPRCAALSLSSLSDSPLPTRLVDCTVPDHPYLATTGGKRGSYLALSYVWGEPQPHSTIMSNVSAYTRRIDPARLPQTIRDAIQVTHALGFQYLWLDTLCIIQDSEDDRRHELARMHSIYRNAYLTIIAASASKVSEGFLQERLPSDPRPTRYKEVSPDIRHLPFICPSPSSSPARDGPSTDAVTATLLVGSVNVSVLFASLEQGYRELYNHTWEPISTRAWCMQEYMMSPRALLFTSQTLQFRCQTTTKNVGDSFYSPGPPEPRFPTPPGEEGGERRLPDALFFPSPPPLEWQNSYAWLEVHEAWLRLAQDYTRCALSVPADKLPACGALAAQFHRVLRTDYLAGLWREMLLNDLLWRRRAVLRAPVAYRAPSWSWAALDGPVGMRKREPGQTALASVVRCDVVLEDAELPFGQVKGGTLVLRGRLIRSVWRRVPGRLPENLTQRYIYPQYARQARSWELAGDASAHEDTEVKVGKKCIGEVYMDYWKDDMDAPPKLWIVLMSRQPDDVDGDATIMVVGLVLALAEGGIVSEQGRKVYRRVGYFEIEDSSIEELGWYSTDMPMVDVEIV